MVEIISLVLLGMFFITSMVMMLVALTMGNLFWNISFFVLGIVSIIAFIYQMHKIEEA